MDPIVLAALIAAAAAVIGPWLQGRKTRKATTALSADIATNHGKRPGEYLEEIHAGLICGREEVADIRRLVVLQTEHSANLARQLADHTVADAVNFQELHSLITERNQSGRKS